MFSDLYSSGVGRPSVPPEQVAAAIVLQSLEGLSDREAAERLTRDVAWKLATGIPLTEPGFHPTVFTYFHRRLQASEDPERIFEAVRKVVRHTGVLRGRIAPLPAFGGGPLRLGLRPSHLPRSASLHRGGSPRKPGE